MSDLLKIEMRISNPEHPHFNRTGFLTGEILNVLGNHMARFRFSDCDTHALGSIDACYVNKSDLKRLEVRP